MMALSSALQIILLAGQAGFGAVAPGDGTYKTEPVTSQDACMALCQADTKCRGAITYQPDTRYPAMECRLNDGLSSASPFEVKTPDPVDLNVATAELNIYRAKYGLGPVQLNQQLIDASEIHARDLAKHGIIAHEGTDGSTHGERVHRTGYQYSISAENVATGQQSWDIVFKAWQDSPGHNENLLLPDVTEFGIALVFEPTTTYATYWAMLVAAPLGP